ncbi:MAG: glutathione peroxidase [Spongiibacteraceae bacterium]
MTTCIYDLSCRLINGKMLPLAELRGQVLLIVNTASYCGFTPQYSGLETLYKSYHQRGFNVLGFPSNDFMEEPFNDERVHNFCLSNYGVSFPLFAKVHVNGNAQDPLFAHLKQHAPGLFASRAVKWNFSKFLLDRNGKVVARYGPLTLPSRLRGPIEKLLDRTAYQSSESVG